MQINSGLRSVLAFPWVYRLFDKLVGSKAYEEWFIKNVLGLRSGQKLVDVGCGPAQILDRLPRVEYVGLDISDAYIQAARIKFKARGGAISFPDASRIGRLIPLLTQRTLFWSTVCCTTLTMTRRKTY
jgi:SAM-dependent methyltransferase